MIHKSEWANKWPCVEIDPYGYEDFEPVMEHIAAHFKIPKPVTQDLVTITVADFVIREVPVTAHMDNWTFSIAAENENVRDELYTALLSFPARK
jgi:hypothetical protein